MPQPLPPSALPEIDVRALVRAHGLWAKRSFGQSFLTDMRVVAKIADAAAEGAEHLVEIGPGLGSLTRALALKGPPLVAVEVDTTLLPILRANFAPAPHVTFVRADATGVEFAELVPPGVRPHVAGNLPYSVTSPLLLALLRQRARLGPATVMIQREVAERLRAGPNSKEYGSLSVLFQMHADVERVLEVSPQSFWPVPKVRSTVLRLRWLAEPRVPHEDPARLETMVRTAFQQRRKTLRNALSRRYGKPALEAAERASGVALERRAETLGLEEFVRLDRALGPAEPDHSADRSPAEGGEGADG